MKILVFCPVDVVFGTLLKLPREFCQNTSAISLYVFFVGQSQPYMKRLTSHFTFGLQFQRSSQPERLRFFSLRYTGIFFIFYVGFPLVMMRKTASLSTRGLPGNRGLPSREFGRQQKELSRRPLGGTGVVLAHSVFCPVMRWLRSQCNF